MLASKSFGSAHSDGAGTLEAGYRGVLRIMAPKLPNRQIVLRELRSHAVRQGLTLEMVEQP